MNDIPDIRDIKDVVAIDDSGTTMILLIGCALALALGAVLLYLRQRKRRANRRPIITPETTLSQLQKLKSIMIPERADEFATRLADILRNFLESRFQLQTRRQTTAEFIRSLTDGTVDAPPILMEQRANLRKWLQTCDMAKFARRPPTAAEMQTMYQAVGTFIRNTGNSADKSPTEERP